MISPSYPPSYLYEPVRRLWYPAVIQTPTSPPSPLAILLFIHTSNLSLNLNLKMDTTTLPTPEHCLADFCLIPVRLPIPTLHRHNLTTLPDWDCIRLRLSPGSRCPTTNRAIRPEIRDALRRNDSWCVFLFIVVLVELNIPTCFLPILSREANATAHKLVGCCDTSFLTCFSFNQSRRILGPSTPGYWPGAYTSTQAGHCTHSD